MFPRTRGWGREWLWDDASALHLLCTLCLLLVHQLRLRLAGLRSWRLESFAPAGFLGVGTDLDERQGRGIWEEETGKQSFWCLGKPHRANLGPARGTGPGAFTQRPHQTCSPAEDPLPCQSLRETGAVTTPGFSATSETTRDEPGNWLNSYWTKVL